MQKLLKLKKYDQTNSMMNNLELNDTVAPETRDGFKIKLLNKTAIAEIFTFWFQRLRVQTLE
jgi:hypothetical protein